jgi:hypothetical protein
MNFVVVVVVVVVVVAAAIGLFVDKRQRCNLLEQIDHGKPRHLPKRVHRTIARRAQSAYEIAMPMFACHRR